jgi:hypothetical protein
VTYHRHAKSEHYVYFARAGGMMKIGCSRLPVERLKQIGEWVPFKVELAAVLHGAFDTEAALHSHFGASWSHLEWFHVTPEMEAMVADILAGRPITITPKPKDNIKAQRVRAKKAATRRVTLAEDRANLPHSYHERRRRRPAYLTEALASFEGGHGGAPSPAALAAIARYEAELAPLAKAAA